MKILVYSGFDTQSIKYSLGRPEYSYYFVLVSFVQQLSRFGSVIEIGQPYTEVDTHYDECQARGESCIFLCFAPPQLVPVTLRCPTIPVIAWEFSTIPCESWGDDPRSDWRVVFRHCGRAITLSQHTARLVREVMGSAFPVFAIPTPSFDSFGQTRAPSAARLDRRAMTLGGFIVDSGDQQRPDPLPEIGLDDLAGLIDCLETLARAECPVEAPVDILPPPRRGVRARLSITRSYVSFWYRDAVQDLLPRSVIGLLALFGELSAGLYHLMFRRPAAPLAATEADVTPAVEAAVASAPAPPILVLPQPPEVRLEVEGVVYVSVFSPQDGRKNWPDILTAFIWAFRECDQATLILKMPQGAATQPLAEMEVFLAQLAPFRCRVLLISAFLEDEEYRRLVGLASFYVNASSCEGLCLPLMEFLSAGIPAIAPDHTAMSDYIQDGMAFLLRSSLEHNVWPHDPRHFFTTMRHRLDWSSLVEAYRASFQLALCPDGRYGEMARKAQLAMQNFCSGAKVHEKLEIALADFLAHDWAAANSAREVAE